jgi:hypothetical protein
MKSSVPGSALDEERRGNVGDKKNAEPEGSARVRRRHAYQ